MTPNAYVPDIPEVDDPESWHPEDMLVVPLRHSDGHLLGILGGGRAGRRQAPGRRRARRRWWRSPPTPRWPSRAPRRAAPPAATGTALEQLLQVSSQLTETFSIDDDPRSPSACGIQRALGFDQRLRSSCPTPTPAGWSRARRCGWDLSDADGDQPDDAGRAEAADGAGVRDRGLLPASTRAGDGPGRRAARHVPLADERPRPQRVDRPLAVRAAVGPHRRPDAA